MSAPPRSVLERCLNEPGYTPPQSALPELLRVLAASPETEREALERALARAGSATLEPLALALEAATGPERPRLLALAARLASSLREVGPPTPLLEPLLRQLRANDAASRKWAARALGKLGDEAAELPLLRALTDSTGTERKSVIDALAVLGGAASLAALSALSDADADAGRRRQRALALIERRLSRGQAGALALDRALEQPRTLLLACRAGLAELLAAELVELGLLDSGATPEPPRGDALRHVTIEYAGTLRQLLRARLALDVGLSVPLDGALTDPVERIAAALTCPATLAALACWTDGQPRFRIAWSDGGHHRARTWAVAQSVRRRSTQIVNDAQQALWTARVPCAAAGELVLVPRLDPDPRFAYRMSDVRAASHPTLAAALARAAGVRADDVVWDPFVGSGLELVERARRGPLRELWGSDIDPRALAAARANLNAAGLSAQLVERSALEFAPAGVSLILTNPPMGRRVARDGSLAALLEQFVRHAARVLCPGGRLVWLSPQSRQTERVARDAGLAVTNGPDVDLGGFTARLQICARAP